MENTRCVALFLNDGGNMLKKDPHYSMRLGEVLILLITLKGGKVISNHLSELLFLLLGRQSIPASLLFQIHIFVGILFVLLQVKAMHFLHAFHQIFMLFGLGNMDLA